MLQPRFKVTRLVPVTPERTDPGAIPSLDPATTAALAARKAKAEDEKEAPHTMRDKVYGDLNAIFTKLSSYRISVPTGADPEVGIIGVSLRNAKRGLRMQLAWWTQEAQRVESSNSRKVAWPESLTRSYYVHAGYITEAPGEDARTALRRVQNKIIRLFGRNHFRHKIERGRRSTWWWRNGYDPAALGLGVR